jgi:tripartite-type tricarboxylate transporter receptor subunit TctC
VTLDVSKALPKHRAPLVSIGAFGAALALCLIFAAPARTETYPDRPIKVIAPFTPGSPNDVVARLIATPMAAQLGQSVVIDNRPGGGTAIGVKAVMAAEPDGYTLMISNSPTHFISPLVSKTFTYDPLKDFVPIATVASGGLMLVIAPEVPAKTLQEFITYAKANPGKLNFGFGQGTLPQLVGEMFKLASGTDIANIPYKGGAQAIPDMLGGRVQMNIGTISTLAPLVRQGKLRALAITSAARNDELPDVPTMAESGLPEVASVTYYGLFGPAGMPAEAVTRLNATVNESLNSPELRAAIHRIGFEAHPGSPEDFTRLLANEMKVWIPIVKKTGFQLN